MNNNNNYQKKVFEEDNLQPKTELNKSFNLEEYLATYEQENARYNALFRECDRLVESAKRLAARASIETAKYEDSDSSSDGSVIENEDFFHEFTKDEQKMIRLTECFKDLNRRLDEMAKEITDIL